MSFTYSVASLSTTSDALPSDYSPSFVSPTICPTVADTEYCPMTNIPHPLPPATIQTPITKTLIPIEPGRAGL
ncbi:hypothetical protein IEQ34_008425 [Dendrobium chrysotoxum]|uniref:Uncharacterized protein n=1 Tax=Dendrobium chrysotoxum TaxID=161865 RepID=A0AAV7H024_DENCH|nr:hypothetical protein IEQ34_008425 [Dendrobium chrysotoxum]